MKWHTESTAENVPSISDETRPHHPPVIKARQDTDECSCIDCRNISTTTTSRTVLDALLWSVELLRAYPSILVLGLSVVIVNRVLETGAVSVIPGPVVGIAELTTGFVFVFLLRAYVATVTAGVLTGNQVSYRSGLKYSLRRIPALFGVFGLIILLVMTVSALVVAPLFFGLVAIVGDSVEMIGFAPIALIGGITFAIPFMLLLYKFWMAPEACVIGGYGPIKSLRVSWKITTAFRTKLVVALLFAIGTAGAFYLLGFVPGIEEGSVSFGPVAGAISVSLGEILSVVWMGVYAHLYVQGIIDL